MNYMEVSRYCHFQLFLEDVEKHGQTKKAGNAHCGSGGEEQQQEEAEKDGRKRRRLSLLE
jgi:hypothetical protein